MGRAGSHGDDTDRLRKLEERWLGSVIVRQDDDLPSLFGPVVGHGGQDPLRPAHLEGRRVDDDAHVTSLDQVAFPLPRGRHIREAEGDMNAASNGLARST
jgi:hypothetical protein